MAVGTTQVGANFRLKVSATSGGTYEPVSHINSYNRNSNRTIAQFPSFGNATIGVPGAREVTWSVGGYKSVGDAGQDLLETAEKNNTTVFVQALHDGTNGFEEEVRVGSKTAKALHLLYFHPSEGLIPWIRQLGVRCNRIESDGLVRFRDLVGVELSE